MSLIKPTEGGRMYPGWWRWNPIGGCEHGCSYCYMKPMEKRTGKDMATPVFREGYLKDNLGNGRKIFCCSSGDAWGGWVSRDNIGAMLTRCGEFPDNEYMFLTKNPRRYKQLRGHLGALNCVLGATVETDDAYVAYEFYDNAPSVEHRMFYMWELRGREEIPGVRRMISIEPVMKFTSDFAERLEAVAPDHVYIGVDSGKNGLPEPTADELAGLIEDLRGFTDVRLKKGIERILGADYQMEPDDIQVISEPKEPGEINTCLRP